MRIFRCHQCDAPTEENGVRQEYFFFQGVLSENIPDETGRYRIRPIFGSLDPRASGNPPRSFCTLDCFMAFILGKLKVVPAEYPRRHPLNEL